MSLLRGQKQVWIEQGKDPIAERARLKKELDKIEAEIGKAQQRLANPSFTQKAPPQVLQEHQPRLAEWQAKREQVRAAYERLAS